MSSKIWVYKSIMIVFSVLLFMCMITYVYDPYCYYRLTDGHLKSENPIFVNAGIAKNADYDTVIIGSSMTQNFNMDSFRQNMGLNSIKLTLGGLSIAERNQILSLVTKTGRAEIFIFNFDLASLNNDDKSLNTFPIYLYDDSWFNDYKYLLGYENWMRIMPVSLAFNILDELGVKSRMSYGTGNIDNVAEWQNDYAFSADVLKNQWINNTQQVASQDLEGMQERLYVNVDNMIDDILEQCNDKQIIFFFPPYSALYWHGAEQDGYSEIFQTIKKYIVNKLNDKPNVTIYDFQCMPIITDLDNYKDTTHYSAEINDLMVECMAEDKFIVNSANIDKSIYQLHSLIESFAADNADWLNNKQMPQ